MAFSSPIFDANRLTLGILTILAMVSWWWSQRESAFVVQSAVESHRPDYWIERLSANTMGIDGHLTRVIKAERSEHYPDDKSTSIVRPQVDFIETSSSPPWRVHSETGWLAPDGKVLLLKGIVTVDREATRDIAPVHLTTRELRVQPQENYAETAEPVQMKSGRSYVQSRGMQIWLKKPTRIKLLAAVRAHYEINK